MQKLFVFACVGFVMALIMMPLARSIAIRYGLIDRPTGRKRHEGNVPLSGGMVFYTCLMLATPFMPSSNMLLALQVVFLPVFLLGIVDDRFGLSAWLRLSAQIVVGLVLVVGFDIKIVQLDGILSSAAITMSVFVASVFTVFCVCGVINAMNMVDGVDGLLGSLAVISFGALGFLSFGRSEVDALLAFFAVGVLGGYLLFNTGLFGSKRLIFMGDSGSMLVGVVMVVLLIDTSQQGVISPTSAGWLLGLPLLDAVSVMVRRVHKGLSPFAAGRDHMHYVLQDAGLSPRRSLSFLVVCQLLFVGVGMLANTLEHYQMVFFWLFVVVTIGQIFFVSILSQSNDDGEPASAIITYGTLLSVLRTRD